MSDHTRPVTGYPAPPPPAPNGYAYPYPAHPHPPQPTYFNVAQNPPYPDPYATQQRATFLRRVFAVFIACTIIIGTVIFIIWLVLRPQVPQFHVQTLTLTKFNLTSSSFISGNWNTTFTVRNPNSKITLYYDHIESAIFYKSNSIADTTLSPFMQKKKNETVITATFASLSAYFDDRDEINRERSRGTVNFNLRILARVRFKAGGWWTRRRLVRVYCPNLSVAVAPNGTAGSLTGGSKRCRVGL